MSSEEEFSEGRRAPAEPGETAAEERAAVRAAVPAEERAAVPAEERAAVPAEPPENGGPPAGDGPLEDAGPPAGDGPLEEAAALAATPEVEATIEADEADEADGADVEVEEDLALARVARERDEYLDALRRLQADFENYKKRMIRQQTEHLERAAATLVEKLLPVFDTTDLAIAHGGGEEVKQIWTALFETLEREGLERIDPLNAAFDPTVHDAVAHEPGDGPGEPEVVEVMRAGYRWKGRVLRPAMVKVRG
jgi:molecular chaperone GrpE